MHFLDLPQEVVLAISEYLSLPDIAGVLQTCKTLYKLNTSVYIWSDKLREFNTKYGFPPGSFDPTTDASEAKVRATRPYRFQRSILSRSLQSQRLLPIQTNVTDETLLALELAPGGRWLVTISSESHSATGLSLRVWDVRAIKDNTIVPAAQCQIESITRRLWAFSLAANLNGATFDIRIRSSMNVAQVLEFHHLDNERPFRLSRSVDMLGEWQRFDVKEDGDWQFFRETRYVFIRNWKTEDAVEAEVSASVLSSDLILSVGQEGLATFDPWLGIISFFGPIDSALSHQRTETSDQSAVKLPLVWQRQVQGASGAEAELLPAVYPPINRPFHSKLHGPSVLIWYPRVLTYVEFAPHPRSDAVSELRAHPVPPDLPIPWIYGKTAGGHVVGAGRMDDLPLTVLTVLTNGGDTLIQSIRNSGADIEHSESAMAFLCTFGGVIGEMRSMEKIWLWQIDSSAS